MTEILKQKHDELYNAIEANKVDIIRSIIETYPIIWDRVKDRVLIYTAQQPNISAQTFETLAELGANHLTKNEIGDNCLLKAQRVNILIIFHI